MKLSLFPLKFEPYAIYRPLKGETKVSETKFKNIFLKSKKNFRNMIIVC